MAVAILFGNGNVVEQNRVGINNNDVFNPRAGADVQIFVHQRDGGDVIQQIFLHVQVGGGALGSIGNEAGFVEHFGQFCRGKL